MAKRQNWKKLYFELLYEVVMKYPGETRHETKTEEELRTGEGNYYESPIYTQRFLPRWVYRAKDYTMISIDTQTDGNKFLIVLDNVKERLR